MKKGEAGWIVIHMVYGAKGARSVEEMLKREGFMARVRQVAGDVDEDGQLFEVLALPSEAVEARKLLIETGI